MFSAAGAGADPALALIITSITGLITAVGGIVLGLLTRRSTSNNSSDIDKLRNDRAECRRQLAALRRQMRALREEVTG